MDLNRDAQAYQYTIQQPEDNVTDVELGDEDDAAIELADLDSRIEPRTRFTDFALSPSMITLDPVT